jgi:hypothetical protein
VEDNNLEEISNLSEMNSFRDRINETWITKITKYLANYFIATLQVLLNVYLLLFGLVSAIFSGFSYLLNWENVRGFSFFLDYILWFLLISFLLMHITAVATKNIRSKYINLLWAVNFFGKVRNNFYSKEIAREHIKTTEEYISEVAAELVEDAVNDYKIANKELEDVLIRLQEKTANFPVEFFDSIVRMIELLSYSLTFNDDKRYSFENVLDKFLGELCTYIPGAHQGSIFLYNGEGYQAYGNFNVRESALRNRTFSFAEGFSGAVALEKNAIWVYNIDTEEAEQAFGFSKNPNRTYSAIFGYPILCKKETIGIINIHFLKPIHFTDLEMVNIEKLTQIVCQFILSLIQLNQYPINIENDIIIQKESEGDDENVGEKRTQ